MSTQPNTKKMVRKRLSDATVHVYEELNGTKATDKTKKSLTKSTKKVSRTVLDLLKKETKKKVKQEQKKVKELANKDNIGKPKKKNKQKNNEPVAS